METSDVYPAFQVPGQPEIDEESSLNECHMSQTRMIIGSDPGDEDREPMMAPPDAEQCGLFFIYLPPSMRGKVVSSIWTSEAGWLKCQLRHELDERTMTYAFGATAQNEQGERECVRSVGPDFERLFPEVEEVTVYGDGIEWYPFLVEPTEKTRVLPAPSLPEALDRASSRLTDASSKLADTITGMIAAIPPGGTPEAIEEAALNAGAYYARLREKPGLCLLVLDADERDMAEIVARVNEVRPAGIGLVYYNLQNVNVILDRAPPRADWRWWETALNFLIGYVPRVTYRFPPKED